MDPITSTTAGVVSPKTTPLAPETAAPSARVADGRATAAATAGPFAGGPATAAASDIPEPPSGSSDSALGQDALDKALDAYEKLERELEGIDPSTPEWSKKMMLLQMKLNRVQETIRIINEMRRAQHETNMSIIDNIA